MTRAEFENESERTIARGLAEALGEGWAVDGVDETLRALGRGQVRTLLLDADLQRSGFRSAKTGRLAAGEGELRADGDVHPLLDLIDDAIEEALRQKVDGRGALRRQGAGSYQGPRRTAPLPVSLKAVLFDAGNTLIFLDYRRLAPVVAEATGVALTAAGLEAQAGPAALALENADGTDRARGHPVPGDSLRAGRSAGAPG